MNINKNIDINKMSAKMMSDRIVNEISIADTISKIKATLHIDRIEVVKTEIIQHVLWIQLLIYDNDILPIKIDILKDIFNIPTKNIYLSPGSALNVETNFISPKNKNLAIFLANKGYLVIGITPREDASPLEFNFGLMRDWGVQKHTDDFKEMLTMFQTIYNRDYDVLGHSAGAINVLNYASQCQDNKLKAVRVIDIVGQYPPDSPEFQYSQTSLNAANQVINSGIFVNMEFLGMQYLLQQAQTNPTGDSGMPRPPPLTGNFTNEAILYFSLINTGLLPGTLTDLTGLPGSWYFKQGYLAGTYEFGQTPADDVYSLTHTNIATVYSAVANLGSGIYPMAYDRDFYAVWGNSFPSLVWDNIRVPVFYINTELGFGDVSYTTSLLRNSTVNYNLIPGNAHADPVYSETANTDFWNKLFP